MKCNQCGFLISHKDAPEMTHCTMCGVPMQPDMIDILQHNKYGIVNEVRPMQVSLAQDVDGILSEESGTLLTEGGTGIGKSFAYLIPALLKEGKRIVISTAKKTLQDQLYDKDIPYLLKKMGIKTSYGIYKGKSNYACWKLVNSKDIPPQDKPAFKAFIDKAKAHGIPADIADWKGPKPIWWSKINGENCMLKSKCQHFDRCLPQPKDKKIVVTNHALVSLDMRISPGSLLGPYDILIVDEAHQMPDSLRKAWTLSVTERTLKGLSKQLDNDDALRGLIDDTGITTANLLRTKFKELITTYNTAVAMAMKISNESGAYDVTKVLPTLKDLRGRSNDLAVVLFKINDEISRAFDTTDNKNGAYEPEELLAIQSRVVKLHRGVDNISTFVGATINGDPTVEESEKNVFVSNVDKDGLHLKPLQIGKLITPRIKGIRHKIYLSATLAVDNKFDYAIEELGLQAENTLRTSIYTGAFDIEKQAILYMPLSMPLPAYGNTPERAKWVRAVAEEIIQLTRATKGDAFVLFSAKTDMNEVFEAVDGRIPKLILQNGETTAILKEYKSNPGTVLFALKTFWEGVDVPGDRLKLVVIPKLSFPHPKDPVIAGLNKAAGGGKAAFDKVSVPRMLFDMKQGVGRLLRTKTDKGIIAILDIRAWTGTSNKRYHPARIQKIKYAPNKVPDGYGLKLVRTIGYANRIAPNFEVCNAFIKKFFP